MTIRNLDAIFRPRSVALIGASTRPRSVGAVVAENLQSGGFGGPLLFVNPKYQEIGGTACYPDIASLPAPPDLAVICTPPRTVPGLIAELGARGTKGAIVITAGFRETGEEGAKLERAMLEAAKPHLLRIVGPNCVGVLSTPAGLNASFAPGNVAKGGVAFLAQSGAMLTTILDWASSRSTGFSHLVSLGGMADADFGDMLDYLANDPHTNAILLYIEAVTSARKFMSAARAASRLKPVIAIKAGRHEAAARAAASHTGAMAGVDGVYDAAFRRAGILRVRELEEVFEAVETLAWAPSFTGSGLVILTNGGGVGVMATDSLADRGGDLTTLSPETIAKLDAVLPPTWPRGNPVDIIGDADGERYANALSILLEAPETNAVLVLNCPTALAPGIDAAEAVIRTVEGRRRCVLTNWLGAKTAEPARRRFMAAGIPTFDTPGEAVRGFSHLMQYRRGQEVILEVPPSIADSEPPDEREARRIIGEALQSGDTWLGADAVQRVLECYRIPAPRAARAANPEEAAELARSFAAPVAVKIQSPDFTHKSEIGGVALNLVTPEAVKAAAEAMILRARAAKPNAQLSGFLVQEMIHRPGSYELIAGMAADRQFGPFLLFGQGGTAVEVIGDKALALPPLNIALARELISQTRIYRQLKGFRDKPPVALDAIAQTLVRVSQLVCDLDEIVEIDINPLLADPAGVIALDTRIRVEPPSERRGARLAIRPYPREWEETIAHPDLQDAVLRPVRPADAHALARLIESLLPEAERLGFLLSGRSLEPRALARLTQIDYDREMVFVLTSGDWIAATARLATDPDGRRAEFAMGVRGDLRGRGIGRLMLERLIAYAKQRGIGEIFGETGPDNAAMLALSRKAGFAIAGEPASSGRTRISLRLQ